MNQTIKFCAFWQICKRLKVKMSVCPDEKQCQQTSSYASSTTGESEGDLSLPPVAPRSKKIDCAPVSMHAKAKSQDSLYNQRKSPMLAWITKMNCQALAQQSLKQNG